MRPVTPTIARSAEGFHPFVGLSRPPPSPTMTQRTAAGGNPMAIEHLTPTDAAMLALEDADHRLHLQIAYVFEGEAPSFDEFRATVERCLPGEPRFRQRIVRTPMNLGRPAWVDDEHFDLDRHLWHSALPAPGSEDELRAFSDRLVEQPLDMRRPLWEMWLIEGLAGGRFAVIHRVHHCMVDGISTQDISGLMFSRTAGQGRPEPEPWAARALPSGRDLLGAAVADLARNSAAAVASGAGRLRSPLGGAQELVRSVRALGSVAGIAGSAPTTMLNRPGGPRRRTDWVRQPMSDLRATKSAYGTTINNIVLAACAGALRRYFLRHGEPLADGLRAMVPVSIRLDSERGVLGNRVSAVYPLLPIQLAEPAARVAAVAEEMARLRGGHQGVAMQRLMDIGGFAPPTIMDQVQRLVIKGRMYNLIISNVPGPSEQLQLLGRPLVEVLAAGLTSARHGLNIPMVSYNGTMFMAIGTDPDVVPDGAGFAADLEQSFAELHRAGAALARQRAPRTRRPATQGHVAAVASGA
jgi:diacylglycerol O-acyltransferase